MDAANLAAAETSSLHDALQPGMPATRTALLPLSRTLDYADADFAGSVPSGKAMDVALHIEEEVAEDRVIAEFAKGEIDSPRFAAAWLFHLAQLSQSAASVGQLRAIIDQPDLSNASENASRTQLLGAVRGYPDRMLFGGFPRDVGWYTATLPRNEVGGLLYANYPAWVLLSGFSRYVHDGASNVDRVPPGMVRELDEAITGIRAVESRIRNGDTFGPLILAGHNFDGPLVLVEGHTRATAYARVTCEHCDPVPVLVGVSVNMGQWSLS